MTPRPSPAVRPSRAVRGAATAFVLAIALTALPKGARAQLTDPCSLACGLTLGASSFVFATGTATAVGRLQGGFSTQTPAIVSWGTGFVVAAGAGLALHGNGNRQRRAVYGSALGAAAGALAGLATRSLVGESSAAERVAATLVGAAVGVVAGGTAGALSYDDPTAPGTSLAVIGPSFSIPVGR
jgi:hypothetical protein